MYPILHATIYSVFTHCNFANQNLLFPHLCRRSFVSCILQFHYATFKSVFVTINKQFLGEKNQPQNSTFSFCLSSFKTLHFPASISQLESRSEMNFNQSKTLLLLLVDTEFGRKNIFLIFVLHKNKTQL